MKKQLKRDIKAISRLTKKIIKAKSSDDILFYSNKIEEISEAHRVVKEIKELYNK